MALLLMTLEASLLVLKMMARGLVRLEMSLSFVWPLERGVSS